MSKPSNVGFIGLGNIGKPMAERLLGHSWKTYVHDAYAPAMDPLAEQGATACDTVAEIARQCSHIGICVRDDAQVDALLHGPEGLFTCADPDTLIAIHSTVTRASLLDWAVEAKALGLHLIDAPVTGGAQRAQDGTLCYMVGGTSEQLAQSQPIFESSGEKVVHAGDVGAGIALKLCNNFIQYAEFIAMAEATRLAEACGLSVDVLREVGLSNGVVNAQMHQFVSGRNGMARACTEEEMLQIFGPLGALGLKDMQCALDTAADHELDLPLAEYVRDRIENVFLARDPSRPPQ